MLQPVQAVDAPGQLLGLSFIQAGHRFAVNSLGPLLSVVAATCE